MKSIKSIHTRYLLVSTAIHTLVVLFLALPALDGIRTKIAELGGLTQNSLWIPAIVFVVAVNYVILKIFKRSISEPMLHIAQEIELNKNGSYAFKSVSRSEEEKALKHFVESHSLRATEMETQIDDLENERDKAMNELQIALEKTERSVKELEDALAAKAEIRETAERHKAKNTVLTEELESLRKQKVGSEVQMRAEEIYTQMERAVEAAAYKKIWLPSVLEELKTPAKLILDIANRLDRSWDDTPLNKLKIEVDEISQHCAAQLALINAISRRELPSSTPPEPEQSISPEPDIAVPEPTPVVAIEEPAVEKESEPEIADAIENPIVEEEITVEPESKPIEQEPIQSSEAEIVIEPEVIAEPESEPETAQSEPEKIVETAPVVPDILIQDPVEEESPEAAVTETIPNKSSNDDFDSELEELIIEIVEEYQQLASEFIIDLKKEGILDADVDEEEVGSILSTLLEIAINHFNSGVIRLKVEQTDSFLDITVRCDGAPKPDVANDVTQANRIASAMEQKVAIDMQKDDALYMRLKYALGYGDAYEN